MNIFYKRPCNYEIGDLDKMIFIENRQREYIETDTKNQQLLHIDNSTNLYKIDCDSVKLEENTSFDNNRFQFNYTLTVVLSETKNHSYLNTLDLLQKGDWLIYVKTNDNQYYCVNYEFKPKMTYDCEWSDSNTNVTITFGMNQNIPVLRIDDWVNPNVSYLFQKQCDYSRPKIEVFETIYAKNIDVQRTSDFSFEKIVTRDSFNEVYPLNNSFSFHHVFNGDEYQDTITFDVTRLKSDNPIHESFEFKENVYVVKFDVNGFTYIVGLDEGLFPSYSYSTETVLNKQTITLTRTTNYGILASINYESHKDLTDRVEDYRKPTITIGDETFSAWKCVSPTMSVRLMIPQVSSSGVRTGKYYVLEGYEDYYSKLDVIGTYTVDTVYNFGVEAYQYSEICKDFGKCYINTSLSSVNNMYGSTLTFAIDAPCGWKIYDYDDCLSFSSLSGEGSTTVIITSTCDYDTDTSFKVGSDDIENVYHIIRKEGVECFIKPNTKNITASAQTVQFEVDNIDASRIGLIANPDIVTINAIGTKINVEVPQYTDEIKPRIIEIKGAYGGKLCSVNIVQDHIHISWKDKVGDYICENGNKYQTQQKWSGYTATDINTPLNETRKGGLIELSSSDCTDADIWWFDTDEYTCEDIDNPDGYEYLKWIPTTETLCDGKDKYRIEVLHGSHDNINWHPMSRERQGDLLERNAAECSCGRETRYIDTGLFSCGEIGKRPIERIEYSDDCGNTWKDSGQVHYGDFIPYPYYYHCEYEYMDYELTLKKQMYNDCLNKWVGDVITETITSYTRVGFFDTRVSSYGYQKSYCEFFEVYNVDPFHLYKEQRERIRFNLTLPIVDSYTEGETDILTECGENIIEQDTNYYRWVDTGEVFPNINPNFNGNYIYGAYAINYDGNAHSWVYRDECDYSTHDFYFYHSSGGQWYTSFSLGTRFKYLSYIEDTKMREDFRLKKLDITSSTFKLELENCEYLNDIHYFGTMEEWKNVEYNFVNCPNLTTVHCIDGDIILFIKTTSTDVNEYCDGFNLMKDTTTHYLSGYSEDNLVEYSSKTETELIETQSEECGWSPSTNTTKIYFADGTIQYVDSSYQFPTTFQKNTDVVKVEFGSSVVNISQMAFSGCTNLTSVTFSDSVAFIAQSAFERCPLKEIHLGIGVTDISAYAFGSYSSTELGHPRDIYLYQSCYDSLSSEEKQYLMGYGTSDVLHYLDEPQGNETIVYYTDGTINSFNIYGTLRYELRLNTSITKVELSDKIYNIYSQALQNNTNMTELVIPNTILTIGTSGIRGCSKLELITYSGTIAQWNSISKGSSWKTGIPTTCIVHCTDGDISI